MLQFFKENKLITLGALVVLVGAFAYFMFFSGGSGAAIVTSSDTSSPVSRDLLVTLSNLRTIRLDEAIFADPVFLSLSDFGVTIPPENVGRTNPFAPFTSFAPPKSN